MPRHAVKKEVDLTTRGFTKVQSEIAIRLDGKELPSLEVIGKAMDQAVELIQQIIQDSYKVVPPRTDTPLAEPYNPSGPNAGLLTRP